LKTPFSKVTDHLVPVGETTLRQVRPGKLNVEVTPVYVPVANVPAFTPNVSVVAERKPVVLVTAVVAVSPAVNVASPVTSRVDPTANVLVTDATPSVVTPSTRTVFPKVTAVVVANAVPIEPLYAPLESMTSVPFTAIPASNYSCVL
jgi:hypothetical protein